MPLDLESLRRWPDGEEDGLRAFDAADRLVLDEATLLLPASEVVVIGDNHGALSLGALAGGASRVRVHQDFLLGELALDANASAAGIDPSALSHSGLEAGLLAGAHVVLLRLPRSLDELDDIARMIARHAAPDVTVFAGGRIKHMTPAMNDVLLRSFGRLDVSLARQKSRILTAREPLEVDEPVLAAKFHGDLGIEVRAAGGVFAGTSIDIGTRALASVLGGAPKWDRAIDLASGTGILATLLAKSNPGGRVLATDASSAAVRSTRATALANGVSLEVLRDAGLSSQPEESADLVVLNPPFHSGAAVTTSGALGLFADAGRVLRPGGELWAVWNSHLAYRPALQRLVGPTREVLRTRKFTVTASRRETSGR